MSHHRKEETLWLVAVVVVVYLGIWLWCKLTGQKPQFES